MNYFSKLGTSIKDEQVSKKENKASFETRHWIGSFSTQSEARLNFEIGEEDLGSAVSRLEEYELHPIHAVWLVSRPLNVIGLSNFEHWMINIYAKDLFVVLEFFEHNGFGSFGVGIEIACTLEIENFTTYEYKNDQRKPLKVISQIVPTLPKLKDNASGNRWGLEYLLNGKILESVDFKIKNVSQIADFLKKFTQDRKYYNSLSCNCQTFAYELLKYLVGESHQEVTKVFALLQSPIIRTDILASDNDNNNNINIKNNNTINKDTINYNNNINNNNITNYNHNNTSNIHNNINSSNTINSNNKISINNYNINNYNSINSNNNNNNNNNNKKGFIKGLSTSKKKNQFASSKYDSDESDYTGED